MLITCGEDYKIDSIVIQFTFTLKKEVLISLLSTNLDWVGQKDCALL